MRQDGDNQRFNAEHFFQVMVIRVKIAEIDAQVLDEHLPAERLRLYALVFQLHIQMHIGPARIVILFAGGPVLDSQTGHFDDFVDGVFGNARKARNIDHVRDAVHKAELGQARPHLRGTDRHTAVHVPHAVTGERARP